MKARRTHFNIETDRSGRYVRLVVGAEQTIYDLEERKLVLDQAAPAFE